MENKFWDAHKLQGMFPSFNVMCCSVRDRVADMGRCEFRRKRKVFLTVLHQTNMADFRHGHVCPNKMSSSV